MGLDLGTATTVYQDVFPGQGNKAVVSCSVLPTLIAYPRKDWQSTPSNRDQSYIGEAAFGRREQFEMVSPFNAGPERQGQILIDYVRNLRSTFAGRRPGWPWGVVALPLDAEPSAERKLRCAAGELFERTLLVKESDLFALAILPDPYKQRVIVVDIGARGVRASLVGPIPRNLSAKKPSAISVVIPKGGDEVDRHLKALLLEKYPDLLLTDATVTRLKEKLSFVAPILRPAKAKVVLGRAHRIIDIPEQIQEACEVLVPLVMQAILDVLARAPSVLVDSLLEKIFLVGGGAAIPGFAQRIHAELKLKGFSRTRIHATKDPASVLATGALKYALLTPDDAWEVPLFAYRGV